MDILVHQKRETTKDPEKPFGTKRTKKKRNDRRKSLVDRRRSTNDGIVVSLSTDHNDKRSRFDRRRSVTPPQSFRLPRRRVRSSLLDIVA